MFVIETNPEVKKGLWKNAVKDWLVETKGNISPSQNEIDYYDKILNSGEYPEEIKSFSKSMSGKYWDWKPQKQTP